MRGSTIYVASVFDIIDKSHRWSYSIAHQIIEALLHADKLNKSAFFSYYTRPINFQSEIKCQNKVNSPGVT